MDLSQYLKNTKFPLIDVRSESEFKKGHIPGALNHPILNDTERKAVGICYKQKGKEAAIDLGFQLVGHKFDKKVEGVKKDLNGAEAIVYCWRGGLRSKIFTEILQKGGLAINRLEFGYKSYRKWALDTLDKSYPFVVLGGPTGAGKTDVLHCFKKKGEQVLDLEGIANHRGSAFGGIGMPEQPSNEQYENELAFQLHHFNPSRPIWVENESRHLGKVKLPNNIYALIRAADVIVMRQSLETRVNRIIRDYAGLSIESLTHSIQTLQKRLGHKRMTDAIYHLNKGEHASWIKLMLEYYDKMYDYGNSLRDPNQLFFIDIEGESPKTNAELILNYFKKIEKTKANQINAI